MPTGFDHLSWTLKAQCLGAQGLGVRVQGLGFWHVGFVGLVSKALGDLKFLGFVGQSVAERATKLPTDAHDAALSDAARAKR